MSEDTPPVPDANVPPVPDDGRTIIRPMAGKRPAPASEAPPSPPPSPSPVADDRTRIEIGARPPEDRSIGVGAVLNDIFEVKRFIARGGMGEVYEGINVNTDERLAIKVILPHLADDPNIQDLFRNEARTLQKLSHPALVRYVLLGKERQFGVFYIVTEFIGGQNLGEILETLKPTPAELVGLTRRLAEGLQAAHALGAIHRDIAPDNVILQDGRIDRARIIDFGIAKDLNPGSKTIIGDGFGGKLGFVAPEQLGDFDRQVGPWSDVYSLGVLMLSMAQGAKVDMGASFVEAIDRRRKGVDTSAAPPQIRHVLDRMLVADPALRLRSMDAVIAALGESAPVAGAKPKAAAKVARAKAASPATPIAAAPVDVSKPPLPKPDRRLLIGGGAAALALVLGIGGYFAFSGSPDAPVAAPPSAKSAAGPVVSTALVDTARQAVAGVLPKTRCAWLDLTSMDASDGSVAVAFTGVAGRPAEAEATIAKAVTGAGARLGALDFADVAPIAAPGCAAIDSMLQIRAPAEARHLTTAQRRYAMTMLTDGEFEGELGASAVLELTVPADSGDFALYGLEPSGKIQSLVANRAAFDAFPKGAGSVISDLGNGRFRLRLDVNHSGWSGILLLTGTGGFSDALMTSERTAGWTDRFASAATIGKWQSEMVWYNAISPEGT